MPRVFTPPLVEGPPGPCGCGCALTPETSYGFDVADFAENVLCLPLDAWQRWLVIHAGELWPDGRPRFRKLCVIVPRQNGKTWLLVVLALYWLAVERWSMVLGTSTKLDYAKESWRKACAIVRSRPALAALLPSTRTRGIREANGEQELELKAIASELQGPRYKIAPANTEGGRSLSLDRAVLDELRQHHDYSAWDAIIPAMAARPYAQAWGITNQGGESSVVLHDLVREATAAIDAGEPGEGLGLFEWSAPQGAEPDDPAALCQANPNAGHRISVAQLVADGRSAKAAGGLKLTGHQTEIMCQRVTTLDPAIDPTAWAACLDPGPLDAYRGRIALCLDVSLDEQHATLSAAAVLDDGRVRVEPVKAWDGPGCTVQLAADLPGLVARIKPRALGWFPSGPAASLATDLKGKRKGWPPRGVKVEAIRNDVTAVCMGFAKDVGGRLVAHSGDPLQDAHVSTAERSASGDAWRFTRKGAGHCDAVYAAAGAAHLARLLPRRRTGVTVISIPT